MRHFKVTLAKERYGMGRRYQNPPFVEAFCEFHFETNAAWLSTIPGIIYAKIQHKYPKQEQVSFLNISGSNNNAQINASGGIRFKNEDGSEIFQVAENLLVFNQVKSYPYWENFLLKIEEAFKIYNEVAKPQALQRIALRYINRIEIPGGLEEIDKYLEYRPALNAKFVKQAKGFFLGMETPGSVNAADTLRVIAGSAMSPKEGGSAITLDIEYSHSSQLPELEQVREWLIAAHEEISTAFEESITDKLREIFVEVG
jgi:uncharacterized protein (TIGR04255 family)